MTGAVTGPSLDDPGVIRGADPSDFLAAVEDFPAQVRAGWDIGMSAEGLPSGKGLTSVAVLGMGGSGISGDVAGAVSENESALHFSTIKGYGVPAWVGPDSLVFAVSYSGNTEETLEAFEGAQKAGARIVAITTGGELAERSSSAGIPVIKVPAGLQPRAALGYLTMPILAVCERLGAGPKVSADIDRLVMTLTKDVGAYGRNAPAETNPAKQLATRLEGKIPLIYGSEGLSAVAAYRWKCQFNECAKVPAWSNRFSELNHNEIVGWKQLAGLTTASAAVVVLQHDREHPRNTKRIQETQRLVAGNLALWHSVNLSDASALGALLRLTYFGDFVATYLAVLQGVDPAPVEVIEGLKAKLRE